MKLLHRKHLKEENYNFFKPTNETVENTFKPNSSKTIIFQILIWLVIMVVVIVLLNKFYIN